MLRRVRLRRKHDSQLLFIKSKTIALRFVFFIFYCFVLHKQAHILFDQLDSGERVSIALLSKHVEMNWNSDITSISKKSCLFADIVAINGKLTITILVSCVDFQVYLKQNRKNVKGKRSMHIWARSSFQHFFYIVSNLLENVENGHTQKNAFYTHLLINSR